VFWLTVFQPCFLRLSASQQERKMLTDTALKNLKSKDKTYKVADRDGMYALVKTTGTIVFRFDYRLHGRRETLTLGQYGRDGITLSEARERCIEARKAVKAGQSPAQEKQREKRRLSTARSLGEWGETTSGRPR
jgi:hypothetical protein